MSGPAAGLYLHIPFCARVCPYCDFAVRTGDRERRRRFVGHLLQELALYAGYDLEFDTVYFGGGTPSRLATEDLRRILDAIRRHLRLADAAKIFLEVNPEDVSRRSATAWKRLGVETISLGVQSLVPEGLEFLGRRHDVDGARRAVEQVRGAGFHTVSIDLIYGRPGQRPAAWLHELDRAIALGVQHLSCYQLTIHERTRFGLLERRGRLRQLAEDDQAELFRLTHRHLNASGLQGYEVSQFAVGPDHRSRHNMKYWNHTPYLGLGPGAHSFRDDRRWWNLRRTDPWQARVSAGERPVDEVERLDDRALALEALMTGMRTYAGVDLQRLRDRWGIDVAASNPALIRRLRDRGFAALDGTRLIPTLEGLALADSIASSFDLDAAASATDV